MKRIWMMAALLLPSAVTAAAPGGAFAPQVEGLAGQPLIAADGRLLRAPAEARLRWLTHHRWFRANAEGTPAQWFDAHGRVLAETERPVEYRTRWEPALAEQGGGQDADPLWNVWIDAGAGGVQGMAVIDGSGRVRLPPLEDGGHWQPWGTDRALWRTADGGLHVRDLQGREVMQAEPGRLRWVDGPYPGRDVLVMCDEPGEVAQDVACSVRDADGRVVFRADIDALLPTRDGGWWLRQRDLWQRVDAQGRALGPQRYHQAGAAWLRAGTAEGPGRLPLQVDRYANGEATDVPEPGWLLDDGRFVAFAGSGVREVVDYCPGRWLLRDETGAGWIIDAQARVLARADGLGFTVHPQQPGWRLRSASARHGAAVLDCDGKVLFERAGVSSYRAVGDAVVAELDAEQGARLWLDAQLQPHLLGAGLRLQEDFIAPPLLVATDAQGRYQLYNTDLKKTVAQDFGHPQQLLPHLLVYLDARGRHGALAADGRVLLAAGHAQIQVLDAGRVWTRRLRADGATELTLHDLQATAGRTDAGREASVRVRRIVPQGTLAAIPERDGGLDVPGHVELNLGTLQHHGQLYFAQQWLDRDGRVVASAVRCPAKGDALMAQGAAVLLGADWRVDSDPKQPCTLPESLAALLAGADFTAAGTD